LKKLSFQLHRPIFALRATALINLVLAAQGCGTAVMKAESIQSTEEAPAPSEHRASVPTEVTPEVQQWIRHFSTRGRRQMQADLDAGARHKETIQRILEQNDVPKDLFYLAMIESGFRNHARSPQRAVGMWQLMRGTARKMGLRVNKKVDERRDLVKATEAAARYLSKLHGMFQSWTLVVAAYNAGEGRVNKAIARAGSRDFWELSKKKALPRETMEIVPKFLAAAVIGEAAEDFGFQSLGRKPVSLSFLRKGKHPVWAYRERSSG
jgi:membrane-bound lytic murein transglycosylase D